MTEKLMGRLRFLFTDAIWYLRPGADGGSIIPHDQGKFIMERQEWEAMSARVNAFYASVSDEEITSHNQALRRRHHLD